MEEPNGAEEVKEALDNFVEEIKDTEKVNVVETLQVEEPKRTEPTEEEKAAFRNPARNKGESYEAYRFRRNTVNKIERARLRGFWYWRSKNIEDLRKGKRDTSWGTLSNKMLEEMAKQSK